MHDPILPDDLQAYFQSVRSVPERNARRAEDTRRIFLAEAAMLASPVSAPTGGRLNGPADIRKGRFVMVRLFGSLAVAAAIFFGGGAAVAGAQSSMPEDALYPVKLWSEDVRLSAADPSARMGLALQFADRRAEEILHQVDSGRTVSDSVVSRLLDEDDLALSIAAQSGAAAPAALEALRTRLEVHAEVLAYAELGLGPSADALLLRTRDQLRTLLRLLEGDLQDPSLRERILEQVRQRQGTNGEQDQGADASAVGNPALQTDEPAGPQGNGSATCMDPGSCAQADAGGQNDPGNGGNGSGTRDSSRPDATPTGGPHRNGR
jgi:hypothetical protein